jgi:hypothetical protein
LWRRYGITEKPSTDALIDGVNRKLAGPTLPAP